MKPSAGKKDVAVRKGKAFAKRDAPHPGILELDGR
jgi:hypothetical protein